MPPEPGNTTSGLPAGGLSTFDVPPTAGSGTSGENEFWLAGDVVMCACPDCRSPMSVRLWLMLADCWRCGASIELTEMQEAAIQSLMAGTHERRTPERDRQTMANSATAPSRWNTATPASPAARAAPAGSARAVRAAPTAAAARPMPATNSPRVPSERFDSATLAARPPVSSGMPLTVSGEAPTGRPGRSHRGHPAVQVLANTPAWLVSLVLHLLLVLVLAMITFDERQRTVGITLSSYVGNIQNRGELNAEVDPDDELSHVQLRPDNIDLKDKKFRETLLAADQLARELRIDPESTQYELPDPGKVREWAASSDPIRRSLAVRDPRFRVQVGKREGATTLTEAAVARALRWLAKEQFGDGHWESTDKSWSTVETALALLPFLGAGQTPYAGHYKDNVSKGLRWLIAQQKPDGDLRGATGERPGMYGHGIAAIVLCDAYGLTGDELLHAPAQKALDFIVTAQSKDGGWRYHPGQPGDTSVVGWQLMALQSGRMAGLKVPDETLGFASHFLDRVSHDGGARYAYQPGNNATPTMTAEGLLCRMYLGVRKDDASLVRGVLWLSQEHLPRTSEPNVYYWYYATQVFHHFGDAPWQTWNAKIRDVLVGTQIETGPNAGSWDPHHDPWGRTGGRIFQTALSACTLEVYYRHAPIYRQIKLD